MLDIGPDGGHLCHGTVSNDNVSYRPNANAIVAGRLKFRDDYRASAQQGFTQEKEKAMKSRRDPHHDGYHEG
ncbi:MAG: hypothetical protein HYX43_02995 [Burkholderiales bacterium]|nr:hypothetical protein [Burkholderiales bacterium]